MEQMTTQIEGDQIVIRLPLSIMQSAVEGCPDLETVDDDGEFALPIVTDLATFSAELVRQLKSEEEDGTTPVHRMLDQAFVAVIESGGEGIEVYGGDGYAAAAKARAASKRED